MRIGRTFWNGLLAGVAVTALINIPASAQQQKRPNIVMLMTDDTGWNVGAAGYVFAGQVVGTGQWLGSRAGHCGRDGLQQVDC
jgi:hypothetical protein